MALFHLAMKSYSSYRWIQLMCRRQFCSSRNSKSLNQHGFKTMHRTLDSIRLPLADILSFLMTSGGQKRAVKSGKRYSPQEEIDLRDQKKTPKQAGKWVSKQENTQRKAPGSSARCLQGPGTHSDSCCVVSYWFTGFPHFRISCVCVYVCVWVSQSVIVSACLFNDIYNWHH